MKVLVSDFDLTLYDDNYANNVLAIKKFVKEGNIFIIATGRSMYDLERDLVDIPCKWYICKDGASIYNDKKELYKVLKLLSNETGRRLRNKKLYANSVDIWIKYSNFKKYSKQLKLNNAIDSDKEIFNYACSLFDKLWNDGEFVRALCVGVGNVSKCHNKQLSLFDKKNYNGSNDNNNDKLQKAIDKIRDKYGDNKILYADEIKK